jgi:hypothetical protein
VTIILYQRNDDEYRNRKGIFKRYRLKFPFLIKLLMQEGFDLDADL